ncbi:MAG: UDPGP type 1 family protein [Spirochaetes bacterium]|nr:UDPGP type 1 family protein [Spirochaetota bacterium]
MITFPGYEAVIKRVYDSGQDHVFEYWSGLNDHEKKELLDDLADVDFGLLGKLYSSKEALADTNFEPAPYIPVPKNDREMKEYRVAHDAGVDHVRSGKTAAFVVAGGQGSRLGYDGPKGKFPVGPVSGKTLFQIHAEKIVKYSRKYGVAIPFLIMTSRANHDETNAFFRENGYFGLGPENVFIFPQNMIPSLDTKGRLIMETKKNVFKNPDGHGGSLTALYTSGVIGEMKKRGVETISYFQVDNPLVRIIDPVFIGFQVLRGADVSSKAVKKAYPEEKVGVFVRFSNSTIGIVEYSDLPEEKTRSTDERGELRYSSGSIAIHLFRREFIERLTAGTEISLPFHTARKKIRAFQGGAAREIEGFKFEKFVFDALPLTEKNIVFETLREEEFAPVKNPSGVDSVESAQKMMDDQFRSWLVSRGVRVPASVRAIEISPLAAVEADDIDPAMAVPDKEAVYLS